PHFPWRRRQQLCSPWLGYPFHRTPAPGWSARGRSRLTRRPAGEAWPGERALGGFGAGRFGFFRAHTGPARGCRTVRLGRGQGTGRRGAPGSDRTHTRLRAQVNVALEPHPEHDPEIGQSFVAPAKLEVRDVLIAHGQGDVLRQVRAQTEGIVEGDWAAEIARRGRRTVERRV